MNFTKNSELEQAKIRLTNALAEKNELKNAILKGEYVKISDVEREYAKVAGRIRQKLLGMSVKTAPKLEGKTAAEAAEIIEENVCEILKELAEGKIFTS